MSIAEITVFAGTTLATNTRCMVSMQDTRPVVSRMGYLENGAKFDADGTETADKALGQVRARYLCLPDNPGVVNLWSQVTVFVGLLGVAGTLTGVRAGSSPTTLTCTARCVDVTVEEYSTDRQPTMTATNKLYAYVNVTWEKKSEWA